MNSAAKSNPFTFVFGKEPSEMVSRPLQKNEMIDAISADQPVYQAFMITGVRGSGKTVMLTELSDHFRGQDDWLVADLNPERDLLQALAARLYGNTEVYSLLKKANVAISLPGINLSFDKEPPLTDVEAVLEVMLTKIRKMNKRLLITIDEVSRNTHIKEFISAFQIFVRHDQPVFLLMTGLYENIYDLQNDRSLTFLYRAPKIELKPLSFDAMKTRYKKALDIDDESAARMSRLTKGYPFAFQVLGYLCWQHEVKEDLDDILPEFDQYLDEYVYQKIWSELSNLDKKVLEAMTDEERVRVMTVREKTGLSSGQMSLYRERLKRKGLIDTSTYGYLAFALPRFDIFVRAYASNNM